MKILFINTPRSPFNNILAFAPDEAKHFIHKKLIGPPLGMLTVAAAVKHHDIVFFDTKGEYDKNPNTPDIAQLTRQLIEKHQPNVVATTVITSELNSGLEILKTAKQVHPNILTVVGGLHVTLCPHDLNHSFIDVAIPGQSAHIFRELMDTLDRGGSIDDVGGLYYRKDEILTISKKPVPTWHPATSNYLVPDRKLLEPWRDTYIVGNAPGPSTYMFTSLGCPYDCTFCSIWPEFDRRFYQRNVESVIDELKQIDYDIIRFSDANSVVGTRFMDELFTRIEEEGIRKSYIMDIRADTAVDHPWLIEKMTRNGLKVAIVGFESFRDEELKRYHKSSSAQKIYQAIDIFHQNGIMLRGNYVVPCDYAHDDFKALAEYAHSHRVAYAGYTILSPMPGTVYYEQVKHQIVDQDYAKYNFFNAVLPTQLGYEEFHHEVGKLWLIKKGQDVI